MTTDEWIHHANMQAQADHEAELKAECELFEHEDNERIELALCDKLLEELKNTTAANMLQTVARYIIAEKAKSFKDGCNSINKSNWKDIKIIDCNATAKKDVIKEFYDSMEKWLMPLGQ